MSQTRNNPCATSPSTTHGQRNQAQPFPSGLRAVFSDPVPGAQGSPQIRVGNQNEIFCPRIWYLPIFAHFTTYSQNSASVELLISLENPGSLLRDFTDVSTMASFYWGGKQSPGKIRALDVCDVCPCQLLRKQDQKRKSLDFVPVFVPL